MFSSTCYFQSTFSPKRTRSPTINSLHSYRNQLLSICSSNTTHRILLSASIPELRGIAKVATDMPLTATIMAWTTELFLQSVQNPAEANAYQWKNAFQFIKESLHARGFVNLPEIWFQHNSHVLQMLLESYFNIQKDALAFLARSHISVFFNGMLAFACHYAKHGIPIGISVTQYLQMAQFLLAGRSKDENRCRIFEQGEWRAVVGFENGCLFLKSVHRKFLA
ncbi:hypothetical protein L596_010867 [Steinernema carpocapsae]|uniref:Uncharacterized protein n=1 Tax=Steinernema carpocapsae TaxID=34508 RepID=A0A4U5PJU1_STECR|nr:hypothetical protein L596_010867 [Steinernema carpocapsae]